MGLMLFLRILILGLKTSKELYTTKLFLEETTNFGVIGVAGASGEKNNTNKRVIYSNLTHGVNKKECRCQN